MSYESDLEEVSEEIESAAWEEYMITSDKLREYHLGYSGDKGKFFGNEYSNKSGETYDIWNERWKHYSGVEGEGWQSLELHLKMNQILNDYNAVFHR